MHEHFVYRGFVRFLFRVYKFTTTRYKIQSLGCLFTYNDEPYYKNIGPIEREHFSLAYTSDRSFYHFSVRNTMPSWFCVFVVLLLLLLSSSFVCEYERDWEKHKNNNSAKEWVKWRRWRWWWCVEPGNGEWWVSNNIGKEEVILVHKNKRTPHTLTRKIIVRAS